MTGASASEGAIAPANEPAGNDRLRAYTLGEEIANGIIHGLGVTLSISALTLLIVFAAQARNGWAMGAGIVYGISLVLEYTASTLYHSFPQPRVKHVFKILDHAGIYLLIAGTYTAFTLITLRDATLGPIGHVGLWLFGVVWALTIAGISTEAFWTYRPRWLSAAVYLIMGWLVVIAIQPLVANIAPTGLWLIVAGGLCYTVGTIFYVLKKVPYMHAIWHVLVLAGSILHFLAVLVYVIIPS
ncbi:MAG TPA: hemolysin III family protein [Coriobacteriia bacterium]